MHQFDLLYMPIDTLYGNKYKYILSRIDAASRFKVARHLRMKQAADVAAIIADIYKVGLFTYSKIFQWDSGSEFKGDVTRLLQKHEVMIWKVTTKYKHTQMAFVEALTLRVLVGCFHLGIVAMDISSIFELIVCKVLNMKKTEISTSNTVKTTKH